MRSMMRFLALTFILAGTATGFASAQIGPGPFAAFPSGDATDARFMGFACTELATLESGVSLTLSAPADNPTFTVQFFDGDTGGIDGDGKAHWDNGAGQLRYSIYGDPLRTGVPSPANLIGSWTGNDPNPTVGPLWVSSAANMPDNAWWAVEITNAPIAQAPSGNFFYILVIDFASPCLSGDTTESNIKLAASAPMTFNVPRFGLVAPLRQFLNDGPIIYPGPFPPPGNDFIHAPTTYDGTFEFFLNIPGGNTELRLFDGDLDHGTLNLVGLPSASVIPPCLDFDDPDTPSDYSGFPFNTVAANPEGLAGPGAPSDDSALDAFRRGELDSDERIGCIRYEVIDPDGNVYPNDNPSGNREWEQFRIATPLATDPANSDHVAGTSTLPGGIWRVKTHGQDLSNLNFWVADACASQPSEGGIVAACTERSVYLLGDTVWHDLNGNGVQDPGEPGIKGVKVELIPNGGIEAAFSVVTGDTTAPNWAACVAHNTGLDLNGLYCLGVDNPGSYTVRISPDNFAPGGILEGATPTTAGGNEQTNLISDDNILTYDFGYRGTSSLGDYVWYDANSDAVQDEPVSAGLAGVTVRLRSQGPDGLFDTGDDLIYPEQTTDANGQYLFTELLAGFYRVEVDETTLPIPGMMNTTGNNPLETPLGGGEIFLEADFGYVVAENLGSLGDTVWVDSDGNGTVNGSEAGIDGVALSLEGDLDGDGDADVVATTTTATVGPLAGQYTFSDLPAGSYTVTVDASTLPAGYSQTYDLDGLGTSNAATASLAAGENRTDVDFGYRQAVNGSLGDRVWLDSDADGSQDLGETGINGVTVQLLDSANAVIASAATSGDGNYTFTNLAAGTYSVRVVSGTLPAGVAPTYDLDGIGTAHIATTTLGSGEDRTDVDFGYRGTASLGDRVWNDLDGDGAQDLGEAGLNGITVRLLDGSDNVLATAVTSGDGTYTFSGLMAGTYKVQVDTASLPAGFAQTYDLDGLGTAHVATATLTAGQNRTDVDFGYRGSAALGDRVWLDFDADGAQDAGEAGINGVTVRLLDTADNVLATQVTAGDGIYHFSNLAAGTYKVEVDSTTLPAGLAQTYDLDGTGTAHVTTATLTAGQIRNDVDFGYRGTGSLGDRVWNDADGDGVQDGGEAGLNGVTVRLLDASNAVLASAVTGGNGNYTFTNLPSGSYKVQVDSSTLPAGYVQTYDLDGTATAHIATATLTAGQNRSDVDFGYRQAACTPDAFTALTGNTSGSGTVGNIRTFTSTQGVQVKASAWSRRDSDGLWTKAYLGAFSGGLGVTSTVEGSGANDSHTLDNVGGEHEVILLEFSAPVILDKAYLGYVATASGYGDSDITVAIGTAADPFNNHITVNDTFVSGLGTFEDNDTTSSSVRWADVNAGNVAGNVIIIAASASDTTPDDGFKLKQLSLACPGTQPVTYSVGDRVWSDTDGDGVQDAGEAGFNGVTVELQNGGGTVVATQATSGNGNYTFSNLAAGTYKVRVVTSTLPAGVTQTFDLDGTGTAHIATFTLNANRSDVDFGYRAAVCTPEAFPTFGGNDSESGSSGNIKTFTTGSGVKVKVSAWSRKKSTGAWAPAYLGAYGGGLGVTDSVSDGNGSGNHHTTDNNGSDNYLLFEFDRAVVVDKVSQGYVVTDSDLTAWFGNAPGGVNPYTTHQTLSTAFLSGLTTETNNGGSSTRTADLNAGNVSGNILIVAAKTDGANNTTTDFSNDYFKLNNVTLACGGGSAPTAAITVRGKSSAGTTSKTLTISKPSGTVQNDVMIASIAFRTNSPGLSTDVAVTAPSGWTLVRRMNNTSSTSNGLAVYRKVAGSNEPSSYTWTFVGSASCNTHGFQAAVGGVVSFVNVDTSNPINAEKGVNTSAGNQTASGITTTVANAMLVTSHGTANGNTWTPPSGMTEQVDAYKANLMIEINTATQVAAGATGSKTATDNGPEALDAGNAHILALKPKP